MASKRAAVPVRVTILTLDAHFAEAFGGGHFVEAFGSGICHPPRLRRSGSRAKP